MNEQLKATVNQEFEFTLGTHQIEALDIIFDTTGAHIVEGDHANSVEVLRKDFQNREYQVKVNGKRYTIHIENDLDALIAEMGLSLGADSIENEIHAPMPGLMLEVNVSEGQEVKANDVLCVLEAMKMENALTAPRDGVVKSVNVSDGETVEKGMLLIELEA